MTYQPLARKYRPGQFAELVGQEAVSTALANAISMGREPHALIFTGVRGVGKTTIARLYAKALNCEARVPGGSAEPCNTCASCLAIGVGNHEDVLEIDGASNTGVGDVRSLQETIDYRPQRSLFKVYIIDEVHMLSGAAFNALLKTLEEPPSHVVFVFATTEIHKVPQTIMSRCQAFYLKKLPAALIRQRLAYILEQEGIEAEDKALAVVAREGHGSLRDALTLLDQAIALGHGRVSLASLGWLVANLSSAPYLELLGALSRRDAAAALALVEAFDQGGADFAAVVEETAQLARHAFVVQGLGVKGLELALLGLDDGELAALTSLAQAAAPFDLNRIFRTLVKCRGDLSGSAMDRYIFENYLCEWCLDPGLPDLGAFLSGDGSSTAPPQPRASLASAVAKQAGAVPPRAPEAAAEAPRAQVQAAASRGAVAAAASAEVKLAPQAGARGATGASAEVRLAPVASPAEVKAQPMPAARATPTSAGVGDEILEVGEPRRVHSFPIPLPATWRLLVDTWKQQKPLQARKLEEAHPLEYGPDRIVLAVSGDSYASKSLFGRDDQAKIKEQFRELFGFNGLLIIHAKDALPTAPSAPAAPPPPLPETILAERGRESTQRRDLLIEEARNAPFTRDLLSALGGKLDDVRIPGSD